MSARLKIRKRLAAAIHAAGLFGPLIRLRAKRGFPVLMYHRVLPASLAREATEPGMYVTPQTFAMHLRALGRHFDIRPLAELASAHAAAADHPARPVCFITFDDGWRDFLEYAFPLLQAMGAPATVFLPTAFVGGGETFWSERLARMLRRARVPAPALTEALQGRPELQRRVAGLEPASDEFTARLIDGMKRLPPEEIEALLATLGRRCGSETGGGPPRPFLDWEEVRRLRRSGLVAFGSHSESHRIMTRLSEAEIERELANSKAALAAESADDPQGVAFCFPNGDFDRRILDRVKAHGYLLAVSTRTGWNRRDRAGFCLRRIGMHEDVSDTEPMFLWRLCGGF